jgi:hypothetical protein
VPELCAAVEEEPVEEEAAEAPAELVAALVVAVVPEVEAPDCAATAACVNAASKLEKRLVPEADCPPDAVEFCAPPVPVAPGERCGGDCSAMRPLKPLKPLKPEMALVDIMQFLVANDPSSAGFPKSEGPALVSGMEAAYSGHGSID